MSFGVLVGLIAAGFTSAGSLNHQNVSGFLAEPKSGHGRGVLVIHPWWGLNEDVKKFCKRLAASGFVAFAPDLFQGKVVSTSVEAEALVNAYQPKHEELEAEVAQAAESLSKRTGGKEIAVVGFSFGGYYALHESNAEPDLVRGVVAYYGTGQEDFSKSKASYLGNFAETDPFESKEDVAHLTKFLQDAGRPATFYIYKGTGHWFAEPSVKKAYNKAASELAWTRTLKFLHEVLPGEPRKASK